MDPEIIALVREAVASVMRDIVSDRGEVLIADDMNNEMSSASGSEGEGLDYPGSGMSGAFAFESGKIKVGGIYRARKFVRIEGVEIQEKFTGYAYVEVHMGPDQTENDQVKLSYSLPGNPTEEIAYMMLYKFKDGKVEEDYRGSPQVQMWE